MSHNGMASVKLMGNSCPTPEGTRDFLLRCVKLSPGAHQNSYSMGTMALSKSLKSPRCEAVKNEWIFNTTPTNLVACAEQLVFREMFSNLSQYSGLIYLLLDQYICHLQ